MEDLIQAAAHHRGGYVLRRDLIDLGLKDRNIRAAVHAHLLVRIRHGTYAPALDYQALSPERRHTLASFSVADRLGPGVALSHQTAAVATGMTAWGIDLDTIHLVRLDGRGGRREAGVAFHRGTIEEDELVLVDGRRSCPPDRAVLDACRLADVESGMVLASLAVHDGFCTLEQLAARLQSMSSWPGTIHCRLVLGYAEPRCESVGEARSLYMMRMEHLPLPEVQVEITLDGRVIARSDFGWWIWRHVGEFDGRIKYGRLNPDPSRLEQVLVEEKRREDLIRSHPLGMSRWMWGGLDPARRAATALEIRRGLDQSRTVYTRNATHLETGRVPWAA